MNWKSTEEKERYLMRRSGLAIMGKLIGLVKPLFHIMIVAITTGVLGFVSSIFITIFGAIGLVKILGFEVSMSISTIFIFIIVFGLIRGVLRYIEQLSNHYIAFKLLAIIRNKVFAALRKLSPAKLEGKDKGNLIAIITSDIELLEVFYAHTISPIVIGALTSLLMIIFIGRYNILLGMIAAIAYIVIGVIIPIVASNIGKEEGLEYGNEFGDMNSFILDSLRGLNEIIQYDMGEKRLNMMDERTDKLGSKQELLKKYEGITKAITDIAVLSFSTIMLFTSIFLEQRGVIEFNDVLITTISMMSSFGPVIALASLSGNLRHTLASGDRVLALMEEEPAVEEKLDGKTISFEGASCNNISFSYGNENILEDYFIEFKKNKIIGVHGRSGSGKSTLLKLLMRFWDTDSGEVKISGENIKDIKTDSLRDIQSYVTQETYLFKDTIANNIGIGKEDATLEEIKLAAKKASIDKFIETLPEGYNTSVGELGSNLSSGEKQRIGLARSFLHDAPFILLDEPTSNLDSLNEGIILKALREESKNRTMVLVSHRQSTMNIADIVYNIEINRSS